MCCFAGGCFFSSSLQYVSSGRRHLKFQTFGIKNASASSGRSGRARKVYTESQSEAMPSTSFPVKEIASSVLPVRSFIVVTFEIATVNAFHLMMHDNMMVGH
ncbi:unnamed protein product [Lactuca saligna]|uniref:Uncharacterized protein n=1 Tax=Lactuca saligna TaxID=75948 RepID=A0AA36E7E5_LACSI|nr:unnamed protein product [Lactuca saligna]